MSVIGDLFRHHLLMYLTGIESPTNSAMGCSVPWCNPFGFETVCRRHEVDH